MKKSLLLLKDGTMIKGTGIGASKTVTGELVFSTAMVGYDQALTDPSFAGQILTFSYPLIGNYGVVKTESSQIQPVAMIARQISSSSFHYKQFNSLGNWLEQEGVPVMVGVDTRMIVHKTRASGVLPSCLCVYESEQPDLDALHELVKQSDYDAVDFAKQVTVNNAKQTGNGGCKIVVVDFGVKEALVDELVQRSCQVTVVPATTTAEQVLAYKPDGVLLSPGPGDARVLDYAVEATRGLIGQVPLFGLCFGHQLIALALGGDIYKLPFGHRGANHAVKDLLCGKAFVTSQNHGFGVAYETLAHVPGMQEWLVNLHDGTNEGMRNDKLGIWTTQFHPEASPGPMDTNWIFAEYLNSINHRRHGN